MMSRDHLGGYLIGHRRHQHIGVAEEEYDLDKVEAAFNCLDELSVFAKQLGVEVLVENIPNAFSTAERLRTFVELTRLPLHFCFDTGHAHLSRGIEYEFGLMKDRIRSTHLHDNDGTDDSHLYPVIGDGGNNDRLEQARERPDEECEQHAE